MNANRSHSERRWIAGALLVLAALAVPSPAMAGDVVPQDAVVPAGVEWTDALAEPADVQWTDVIDDDTEDVAVDKSAGKKRSGVEWTAVSVQGTSGVEWTRTVYSAPSGAEWSETTTVDPLGVEWTRVSGTEADGDQWSEQHFTDAAGQDWLGHEVGGSATEPQGVEWTRL